MAKKPEFLKKSQGKIKTEGKESKDNKNMNPFGRGNKK